MSDKTSKDELLDVNQTSLELGISLSSVYRLIHVGDLPVRRYGPVYGFRIKRSEVHLYMKKRESMNLELK